jgi:hypothetical protein
MFVDENGLDSKHPWNSDKSYQQEENTEELLEAITTDYSYSAWFNRTSCQGHVNHIGDN